MYSIDEVRTTTTKIASMLNASNNETTKLVIIAAEAIAFSLKDVYDVESAAIALLATGSLFSKAASTGRRNYSVSATTADTISSYGLAMIYAAHVMLNK